MKTTTTTTTTTKTFSIDITLYEKFEMICKTKNLNKSAVIQTAIREFVAENIVINEHVLYKLKINKDSELVKIDKKEKEFIFLSNGNKINIFDFEILYEAEKSEEEEVEQILDNLISEKSVLGVSNIINTDEKVVDPDLTDGCGILETNTKIEIIKRIKEKRTELNNVIKQIKVDSVYKNYNELSNLQMILSYIYQSEIKIIKETSEQPFIIYIPKQYVDNNFKNILNDLVFDIVYIKEKTKEERIKEYLNNYLYLDFSNIPEKSNHIIEQLKKLIKVIFYVDIAIDVKYDNPIYTITIDQKFICQELIEYISNCYSINKEYIILKGE